MNRFAAIVEMSDNMDKAVMDSLAEWVEMFRKEKLSVVESMEQDFERYKQSGVLVFTGVASHEPPQPAPTRSRGRTEQKENTTARHRSSSSKENREINTIEESNLGLNSTTNSSLQNQNAQLADHIQKTMVKIERLSQDFMNTHLNISTSQIEALKIKQELIDMPPPSRPPLRQTQRWKNTRNTAKISVATTVQVKTERLSTTKSSDVQVLSNRMSVIDLTEESNEEENVAKTGPRTRAKRKYDNKKEDTSEDTDSSTNTTRVTRTKTRNAAKNTNVEADQEVAEGQPLPKSAKIPSKRTKTKKATENKQNVDNGISAYEDAESDLNKTKNGNATVVQNTEVDSTTSQNETVVIEKPTLLVNEATVISKGVEDYNNPAAADLLTEDEDSIGNTVNTTEPKLITMKQIFSPYTSSPVKSRVEAFERLGAEAGSNKTCRMVTRMKTNTHKEENIPNIRVAPLANNNLSKLGAVSKLKSTSKTASSERLKQAEAQAKKEAMLQALAEERRQKRQERQLKAQQMRAASEQEKQKVLATIERTKQKKAKHVMGEKEKLLKQKEASSKNEERRQPEEASKSHLPLYLQYEPPLLPTNDCYDSDDSNSAKSSSLHEWEKRKPLMTILRHVEYVKPLMPFHVTPTTVDLREIFPSIEERRLKRTSSAIWNTSSEMTKLDAIGEEE